MALLGCRVGGRGLRQLDLLNRPAEASQKVKRHPVVSLVDSPDSTHLAEDISHTAIIGLLLVMKLEDAQQGHFLHRLDLWKHGF